MKMNKVILGLVAGIASGSLLRGSILMDAIKSGDVEAVKEAAGDASNAELTNALHESFVLAENGEKIAEVLLNDGADVTRETLDQALENATLDTVVNVVENMNSAELNEKNDKGQTAAEQIDAEVLTVVGALVKKGAKITPGMKKRMAQAKAIRGARQARKAGAVALPIPSQSSPLSDAIKHNDVEQVTTLAEKLSDDALTNALNENLVVAQNGEKIAEILLQEGADVNRDTLSQALESGSLDTVAEVVENMTLAELNEQNNKGQTVAEEIEAETLIVVDALAKKGAKLTTGMQNRVAKASKVREDRMSRKAKPARQRVMRRSAAGKSSKARAQTVKPAAHSRTRRMSQ